MQLASFTSLIVRGFIMFYIREWTVDIGMPFKKLLFPDWLIVVICQFWSTQKPLNTKILQD